MLAPLEPPTVGFEVELANALALGKVLTHPRHERTRALLGRGPAMAS